jgi:hypothetical protein
VGAKTERLPSIQARVNGLLLISQRTGPVGKQPDYIPRDCSIANFHYKIVA